jgi:FlaA1/EpsC-like NDP-sugar epimerase
MIQQLLGRQFPEHVFEPFKMFEGESVLVTGAGGSIGTELCLQLIALAPDTIILYEMSELALYQIDRLLRAKKLKNTRIVPMLGNLSSTNDIYHILKTFNVHVIIHAAAYKHVPMVEYNPIISMLNNVGCTRNLVDAARDANVPFLMTISTDKAVNPTNLMGASKRIAEYVTLAGQNHHYTVVRFGNVLWSNGSVLPLFEEQIKNGQPVTITDPNVTRYFMSIPEAVHLTLQSFWLNEGKICVFDMGEPVNIEWLAKNLAQQLALPITIEYIGLRPGEKLYEELTLGEGLQPTKHPNIKVAKEHQPSYEDVSKIVSQILHCCKRNDVGGLRTYLQTVVPGYTPSCGIVDPLWLEEHVVKAQDSLDDCYARLPVEGV